VSTISTVSTPPTLELFRLTYVPWYNSVPGADGKSGKILAMTLPKPDGYLGLAYGTDYTPGGAYMSPAPHPEHGMIQRGIANSRQLGTFSIETDNLTQFVKSHIGTYLLTTYQPFSKRSDSDTSGRMRFVFDARAWDLPSDWPKDGDGYADGAYDLISRGLLAMGWHYSGAEYPWPDDIPAAVIRIGDDNGDVIQGLLMDDGVPLGAQETRVTTTALAEVPDGMDSDANREAGRAWMARFADGAIESDYNKALGRVITALSYGLDRREVEPWLRRVLDCDAGHGGGCTCWTDAEMDSLFTGSRVETKPAQEYATRRYMQALGSRPSQGGPVALPGVCGDPGADQGALLDAADIDPEKPAKSPKPKPAHPLADYFHCSDKGLPKWSEPKVLDLADAILESGPLAPGGDHRIWAYADGRWAPDDDAVKNRLVKLLGNRYSPKYESPVRDVITAQSPYGTIDAGNPDTNLIGFTNGLLDIAAWKMLPADPSRGFVPCLAVPFLADAPCPNFHRWLADVLESEDIPVAWQIIAYMLVTGNPLQKAIMLIGPGGNGKGTYLRVLRAIIGAANYSAVSLSALTNNRFAPATLYGKLANIAGDIDPTHLKETGTFKMLTGGDAITAEYKMKDPFTFESYAVPLFSANEIPTTADTSVGYFRRWIPLKFPRALSGRFDESSILDEAPGIAAHALTHHLRDVLASGITPNAVTQDEFEMASDPLRLFWSEMCVIDPNAFTSRTLLYSTYKRWAESGGSAVLSNRKVYPRLRALGAADITKASGERGFRIQLQPTPQLIG
jgi:P4 family phage/plasmid primase-like protien